MKKTEKHALTVRIGLLVMLDILFMQVASFASLWIRHEFDFQAVEETFIHTVWRYMPLNILVTLAVFSMFHLYTSLWKYASITELSCIVAAVAISSLLHVLGMAVMGLEMFKSYLLLYFLLFLSMVVGLRFSYRFFRFVRNKCNRGMAEKRENVMIIGAGDAGAAIIKENRLSKAATRKVCCLIDKDPKKWGRYILGCPVVGGADKIMESVEKYKIQKIVIAIPSATSQQIKELVEICKETKCELKILPGIYQLIDGEVSISQLREVEIEDLLGREPVKVDLEEILGYIQGKTVLVNSGAVVDHDSHVGCGAHIGLGSVVKANCVIPSRKKVEEGEVIFSTRRKIDGVTSRNLEDALYAFGFGLQCSYVKPFGEGHINETYAVYMPTEEGDEFAYILQRVNNNVFKDPAGVMENIFGVTEYLRNIIREEGGDPDRETLSCIKTKNGCTYFEDNEGQPWRCYNYISNSVCYQLVEDPEQFYQSGNSFGHFLKQLGNYPASSLKETIPDFHNTVKRFENLEKALKRDIKNRAITCRPEIAFALDRKQDCKVLVEQQENGTLPLRVTHNDTKLNNILFDAETGKGLCIIDLDTIMPGLAANDFGDSIRFGAATAEEDERDLDKMHFDISLYELYVKGYLEATKDVLTPEEVESLPWGARLMTFECGIRFLTDYLEGDTYFKTAYPEHNLVRARTQFRLVDEMEQQFAKMQEIVRKYA